jgi:hypothetical protein
VPEPAPGLVRNHELHPAVAAHGSVPHFLSRRVDKSLAVVTFASLGVAASDGMTTLILELFALLTSARRESMLATIAILMVGCFVIYAVVLGVACLTDGPRVARPVLLPTRHPNTMRRVGR